MKIEVKKNDLKEKRKTNNFELIIVLDNLRSAYNVGNIYRLAEALNIEAIYPCGYTAHPPHNKVTKTARGTENSTSTYHFEHTLEACQTIKKNGYSLIAVETTDKSTSLWKIKFKPKTALIFGNEALGINKEVLNLCDEIVELPLFGKKNSINVSNCASATLFKAVEDIHK